MIPELTRPTQITTVPADDWITPNGTQVVFACGGGIFRNYNFGLDQLIADNDYDQILVLYSFDSFKSDPYLYRAGVAG